MVVYIEGMEMPKGCAFCKIKKRNGKKMICPFCDEEWDIRDPMSADHRLENCPLVEVPPHGRLIDADALHKLFEDQWDYLQVLDWNENPTAEAKQSGVNWCINTMHDSAPTIIPASEEDE